MTLNTIDTYIIIRDGIHIILYRQLHLANLNKQQ